jgi:predicted  nucleic acid-binding Zn-ribbon protein
MDEIISHLRDVAACRKTADELRAKQLAMMQYLRDLNTEIEDIELKAMQALETIAKLSERIEELGQ